MDTNKPAEPFEPMPPGPDAPPPPHYNTVIPGQPLFGYGGPPPPPVAANTAFSNDNFKCILNDTLMYLTFQLTLQFKSLQ